MNDDALSTSFQESQASSILVIDDAPTNLVALKTLLVNAGYRVQTATDGASALLTIQTQLPDLILLDIRLPGMNGIELCRHLKDDERTRFIPVIFITGMDDQEYKIAAFEVGAVDYIAKPLENREVLVRVSTHLALQHAQAELLKSNTQLEKYAELLEEMVDTRTRDLQTAHEKLIRQERLALLGQWAGSISHELRNPLANISTAAHVLRRVLPDTNEKIEEYLNIIQAETAAASKIITDLLDFSRVKALEQKPLAVAELVQNVLERYPAPASVIITLNLSDKLPVIYVDLQQISQVLGNLVTNACQAMPSGGRLVISAVQQAGEIAIAVQDTGVGISPENMRKLFEPLFSTKLRGIGLGLVISQKLAEANGGRIEVQSEQGIGSTFTLFLPVQ